MKHCFLILASSLLFFFSATPVSALDVYVATTGSDTNPGTISQPFKTIVKAQQRVREIIRGGLTQPVTVILRAGVYELYAPIHFTSSDSGNSTFPITWRSYPNENAIISGGQQISNWQIDGDLWKIKVPGSFSVYELFVNDQRATRSRIDSGLTGLLRNDQGYSNVPDTVQSLLKTKSDSEVVIRYQWRQFRCPIDRVENNSIILKQPCWKNVLFKDDGRVPDPSKLGPPSWIEHTKEAIDQPGEWYFDKATRNLWYKPRPGDAITTAKTVIPTINTLFYFDGTDSSPVHNISIRNLDFAHTTWKDPHELGRLGYFIYSMRIYDDLTLPLPGPQKIKNPEAILVKKSTDLSFLNNRFYNFGSGGIGLEDTQKSIIQGNLFTDLGSQAISLLGIGKVTDNITIAQNVINKIGVEFETTPAIFLGNGTQKTEVKNNTIIDVPYSGIVVQNTGNPSALTINDIRLYRNRIIRAVNVLPLDTLYDGGSIYVTHRLSNSIIEENYITDQPNKYGAIYLDQGSQYITIRNNIFFNNQRTALLKGGDNVVSGNWWQDRFPDDISIIPIEKDDVCQAYPELNCHSYEPINNHVITSLNQAPQTIINNAGVTISTFNSLKPMLSLKKLSTGSVRIEWDNIPNINTYLLHLDTETIIIPGYRSSYTFTPTPAKSYEIWLNANLSPELIGADSNHLSYSTTNPADLNIDGKIDILDYNILISNFGKTGAVGWIPSDIIKNGKVDLFDYNSLVTNFGK